MNITNYNSNLTPLRNDKAGIAKAKYHVFGKNHTEKQALEKMSGGMSEYSFNYSMPYTSAATAF